MLLFINYIDVIAQTCAVVSIDVIALLFYVFAQTCPIVLIDVMIVFTEIKENDASKQKSFQDGTNTD